MFYENSSMSVMKYLALPIDVVLMGPHTSECTIFQMLDCSIPPLISITALKESIQELSGHFGVCVYFDVAEYYQI